MLPAVSLFGFLSALLILYFTIRVNPANRFLAYHFILNSLFGIAHWASVVSGSAQLRAIFAIHYFPFYLLNTPFFYFYVRAVLTDQVKLKRGDIIHFVPFLVMLLNIIPYSSNSWGFKLNFVERMHQNSAMIHQVYFPLISFTSYFILRSIISLVYVGLLSAIVWKSKVAGKLKQVEDLEKWIVINLLFVLIFNFSLLVFSTKSLLMNDFVLMLDPEGRGRTVATLLMSALTFSVFFFPKILYGIHFQAGNSISITEVVKHNREMDIQAKGPEFSKARLKQVQKRLEEYLPEKRYLTPGFGLSDLVKDIATPEHLITFYFNNYKGTTFIKWKNQLRIQEAKRLLNLGEANTNTLESVGKACGYKSRSNFIDSFKFHTGESPSSYLKKIS